MPTARPIRWPAAAGGAPLFGSAKEQRSNRLAPRAAISSCWHSCCEGRGGGGPVEIDPIQSDLRFETRLGRSVSIDQAAQLLRVSRRTIYNRIRDGRLQTIRTLGGSQRVLLESLHDEGFRPQAFSASASAAALTPRPLIRS